MDYQNDQRDQMPPDLRRIFDSEPSTRRPVEYELWKQRFAVTNDTIYSLFPLPKTKCTQHPSLRSTERMPREVMMHLLSHLGSQSSPLKVIPICEYCSAEVPITGIAAHMRFLHRVEPFSYEELDIATLYQRPATYCPFHCKDVDVRGSGQPTA